MRCGTVRCWSDDVVDFKVVFEDLERLEVDVLVLVRLQLLDFLNGVELFEFCLVEILSALCIPALLEDVVEGLEDDLHALDVVAVKQLDECL